MHTTLSAVIDHRMSDDALRKLMRNCPAEVLPRTPIALTDIMRWTGFDNAVWALRAVEKFDDHAAAVKQFVCEIACHSLRHYAGKDAAALQYAAEVQTLYLVDDVTSWQDIKDAICALPLPTVLEHPCHVAVRSATRCMVSTMPERVSFEAMKCLAYARNAARKHSKKAMRAEKAWQAHSFIEMCGRSLWL